MRNFGAGRQVAGVVIQKPGYAGRIECWAGEPELDNSPNPAVHNVIPMHEFKWSHAEKTVARRAFDLALGNELEDLVREAKNRAARIEEPSELSDLESWLTERRREIDRSYDYRYSVLPLVFAQLLRDGRLTEDDLHGLGEEKLNLIRRASTIWKPILGVGTRGLLGSISSSFAASADAVVLGDAFGCL